MKIKFLIGFSDYETLDLNEEQVQELLYYFLNVKSNIYENQSMVALIKSGKHVYEIDKYKLENMLSK